MEVGSQGAFLAPSLCLPIWMRIFLPSLSLSPHPTVSQALPSSHTLPSYQQPNPLGLQLGPGALKLPSLSQFKVLIVSGERQRHSGDCLPPPPPCAPPSSIFACHLAPNASRDAARMLAERVFTRPGGACNRSDLSHSQERSRGWGQRGQRSVQHFARCLRHTKHS